jgi:hypothetical protein
MAQERQRRSLTGGVWTIRGKFPGRLPGKVVGRTAGDGAGGRRLAVGGTPSGCAQKAFPLVNPSGYRGAREVHPQRPIGDLPDYC